MKFLFFIFLFVQLSFAVDKITCLKAKQDFRNCAIRADKEKFPLIGCLEADAGYESCRKDPGAGSHQLCLPARQEFAACRKLTQLAPQTCLSADAGFQDCIELEKNPIRCLRVRGGYKACRKLNPQFTHADCAPADVGYEECRNDGGAHGVCLNANGSYTYCRKGDRFSFPFCVQVGGGYATCREKGIPLGLCVHAGDGYYDCTEYHRVYE